MGGMLHNPAPWPSFNFTQSAGYHTFPEHGAVAFRESF